ncbi:MAG TPA: AAA family ATPase [Nitrospirota bacterium]|nr:AAA family ATPase [Nitrospirota bacterium]
MFLVELVMQGVRGFRELTRLRFQSGFNFIAAGNEAGKTTAVDAMQRLLFPNGQSSAMEKLVSRQTPESSRCALVVFFDDGAYYRVIQDFSKCAVNLSKYDTASKEFRLLHKDWGNTVQVLSGLAPGISEEDYGAVFMLRREHLLDDARSPSAPAAATRLGGAARAAAPGGGNSAANEAKLAELRETLRKAEEAADADYRHQSAKLAAEALKKKLLSLEEVEHKKAEIEASLAELKGCESLPENIAELIDEQERRESQKLVDADELSKSLEVLKLQLEALPKVNFLADKLFIAGIIIGALSMALGMFVLTAEYGHYFYIGLIAAMGLMAVAWYNGSRKNVQRTMIKQEIAEGEKDLAELEKKFTQESAAITDCLRTAGAESAADLKERADNFRYFVALRTDLDEQRLRILGDVTPEILHQQYDHQQAEIMELEKAARALEPHNIDSYSIRQDIERLEGEVSSAGASWNFGTVGHDLPGDFGEPAIEQGGYLAKLAAASRMGGIEMETLIPAVEATAQRNLAAISGGKYVRIEVGREGEPILHGSDGSHLTYRELSHGTKALFTFCLRTGLVEVIVDKRRLPFILDDALAGFDFVRQQSACQVLRALGKKTQVILFTSNPALKAAGDAVAELK